MVVEFLTFEVDPAERDQWLAVEEKNWSRYLESRHGFVDKEMWVDDNDPGRVCAVIRWASQQAWDAVPADDVRSVDEAMGEWCRDATMRRFRVIRGC